MHLLGAYFRLRAALSLFLSLNWGSGGVERQRGRELRVGAKVGAHQPRARQIIFAELTHRAGLPLTCLHSGVGGVRVGDVSGGSDSGFTVSENILGAEPASLSGSLLRRGCESQIAGAIKQESCKYKVKKRERKKEIRNEIGKRN